MTYDSPTTWDGDSDIVISLHPNKAPKKKKKEEEKSEEKKSMLIQLKK